jgi:hypothetical protein
MIFCDDILRSKPSQNPWSKGQIEYLNIRHRHYLDRHHDLHILCQANNLLFLQYPQDLRQQHPASAIVALTNVLLHRILQTSGSHNSDLTFRQKTCRKIFASHEPG